MVIGILQVELIVDGSESLKDKRRVVRSMKDRLHREHQVSVAEVDKQESLTHAVLGIVMASSDVKYTQSVLDKLVDKIQKGRGYYLHDYEIEILSGR
ncbi:DUF503 domain-containing protein [Poriferisphaera sp. WC338]|uniref:DUF503 domain-containing protein n=1 Tax=Poriferisphaera sp. WC338 TaxID=3425129 RepID=UPI003D81561D